MPLGSLLFSFCNFLEPVNFLYCYFFFFFFDNKTSLKIPVLTGSPLLMRLMKHTAQPRARGRLALHARTCQPAAPPSGLWARRPGPQQPLHSPRARRAAQESCAEGAGAGAAPGLGARGASGPRPSQARGAHLGSPAEHPGLCPHPDAMPSASSHTQALTQPRPGAGSAATRPGRSEAGGPGRAAPGRSLLRPLSWACGRRLPAPHVLVPLCVCTPNSVS